MISWVQKMKKSIKITGSPEKAAEDAAKLGVSDPFDATPMRGRHHEIRVSCFEEQAG